MRLVRFVPLLVLPGLFGCGDDPFSVEDALGIWDLREFNGLAITGLSPTGVWIREDGGSDSTLTAIQSISLEFAAASACLWTVDDGIQGAVTDDDCEYAISPDGDITLSVGGQALHGTAEVAAMALQDDDTNELAFEKRT